MDVKFNKRFAVEGESREVEVVALVDGVPNKVVSIAYGIWTVPSKVSDDGVVTPEKMVHRFAAWGESVTDGMSVCVGPFYMADGEKAVNKCVNVLYSPFGVNYEGVTISADYEDEFWSQKVAAPKKVTDDVWVMPEYSGVADELTSLLGEAEGALQVAEKSTVATQDDYRAFGAIVQRAYGLVGNSRALLASWAMKGADSGNHPLLAKMGKGVNALTEAMRLAALPEAEFAVLPGSITSGKGADTHRSRAMAELAEEVYTRKEVVLANSVEDVAMPNIDGVVAILELIAARSYGVEVVADMSLADLSEAVDNSAINSAASFMVTYGKSVNTYDNAEYTAAKLVYGKVCASSGGSGMFAAAVAAIGSWERIESEGRDVAELIAKEVRRNLMLKHVVGKATAHQAVVEAERKNREVLRDIGEDGPITKKATIGFGKLDALPAAAHLFKLLCSHSERGMVWSELRGLVKQQGLESEVVDIAAE